MQSQFTIPDVRYCTTAQAAMDVILAHHIENNKEKNTTVKNKKTNTILEDCEELGSTLTYSGSPRDQVVLLQCHILQSKLYLQKNEYTTAYQHYSKARALYNDPKIIDLIDGSQYTHIIAMNAYSDLHDEIYFYYNKKHKDLTNIDHRIECDTDFLMPYNSQIVDRNKIKDKASLYIDALKEMHKGNYNRMIQLHKVTKYLFSWPPDYLYMFYISYTARSHAISSLKKKEKHYDSEMFELRYEIGKLLEICVEKANFRKLSLAYRQRMLAYLATNDENQYFYIMESLKLGIKYENQWSHSTSNLLSLISKLMEIKLDKKKAKNKDYFESFYEQKFTQYVYNNLDEDPGNTEISLLHAIKKFPDNIHFYVYWALFLARNAKEIPGLVEETMFLVRLTVYIIQNVSAHNKGLNQVDESSLEQFDFIFSHFKQNKPQIFYQLPYRKNHQHESSNDSMSQHDQILKSLRFKEINHNKQLIKESSSSDSLIQKMVEDLKIYSPQASMNKTPSRETIRVPYSQVREEEKKKPTFFYTKEPSEQLLKSVEKKDDLKKVENVIENKEKTTYRHVPVETIAFPEQFKKEPQDGIPSIQTIAKAFRLAKKKFYLVGSAIESLLKGKVHKGDYDFATEATPEEVDKILSNYGIKQNPWNEKLFNFPLLKQKSGSIDIYCSEKLANQLSSCPELDDANARDFIQKSMYASFDDKNLKIHFYDPTQRGYDAITNHRPLDTNGPAKKKFQDDPKVMLRAVKYEPSEGLSEDILKAIPECKSLLSSEKVAIDNTIWLGRALCEGKGEVKFSRLVELGLMQSIFPSIQFNDKIKQSLIDLLGWMDKELVQKTISLYHACDYLGISNLGTPPFLIYAVYVELISQSACNVKSNYDDAAAYAESLIKNTPCFFEIKNRYPKSNLLDVVTAKLSSHYNQLSVNNSPKPL